jgi:ammonium transporter, Amt family
MKKLKFYHPFLFSLLWLSSNALADGAAPAKIDTGDTAWVLMATAMVLLMTPGLAFFYAGMVKTKNVVSTLFKNYAAISLLGLLWAACGYTLAFGTDVGGMIGGFNFGFLNGVGQEPNADYSATIPHSLFMLFQCMFAVITPALIIGAVAERARFKAWLAFMVALGVGCRWLGSRLGRSGLCRRPRRSHDGWLLGDRRRDAHGSPQVGARR